MLPPSAHLAAQLRSSRQVPNMNSNFLSNALFTKYEQAWRSRGRRHAEIFQRQQCLLQVRIRSSLSQHLVHQNRTSSYFTTPDFPVLGSILPAKPCQAMSAWRHVEGFMPVVARYAELLSVPCKGPCSVQFGVQVTRSQPRARKHLLSGGTAQKRPGLHDSSGHEMKEEVSTQQSQRSSS